MKYLDGENVFSASTLVFHDPTDDILASFGDLMFGSGVKAASMPNTTSLIDEGLLLQQSVIANQTVNRNIYHADLRWFGGAAALQMVAILAVAPLFWGYWLQGTSLSMSPLAIAKVSRQPSKRGVPC